jgi:cobalt-zinc-cadmium efflux system outer membrane protein
LILHLMNAEYGRWVMRRQTFWNFLLLNIFMGAVWPSVGKAQTVPAAGSANQHERQENKQERSAQETRSTEPGLTLERLQELALANNPTLAQAKAGVRAAAGRLRQAGLWPNPTVGYSGDEIRGGSYGGGEQGVFLQQNVILGGKLGLDRKIFAAQGQRAAAEADEQRLRVENGVRIAFYQSLAMQAMVETRGKLRDIAKDAAETTRQLFNVGQADQPDVLEADVEADQDELAVVTEEQEQQRAWSVLAAVVGKPDLALEHLQGDLETLPEVNGEEILETILRDSPALKIAQLGVARADAEMQRAQHESIPDLFLRAGYAYSFEQLGTVPAKTVGSEAFAEVGVNLPIFNRNQGNSAAAAADRERATLEVQRVGLVLRQMAAPIVQNYASSRAIAERYKSRTLPHARQAYELYLQKYHEGAAAYAQVLIAQRTLVQLETTYINTLENVWINAAALQGLLLVDGLDLPAAPDEMDRPVREINLPIMENPGMRP